MVQVYFYVLKVIKNVSLILIILGHYAFCGYVLKEVHKALDYKPVLTTYGEKEDNDTLEVTLENDTEDEPILASEPEKKVLQKNYLGVITIEKIGLRQYFYDKNSSLNNVDKGIEVLNASDMPDENLGNFIIASHNGNSSIAYFHRLHELVNGDIVMVNYNNVLYKYQVSKIYEVPKTGKVIIDRDYSKKTITMITCSGDDKQLVVVGYLV